MAKQGEFVWHDLATSDLAGATTFYTDLIGWSSAPMENVPMEYIGFHAGDAVVAGAMALTEDMKKVGAPSAWTPCIATENIEATCAKVKELGGNVLNAPSEVPGGRFALLQDPQDAVFETFQSNENQDSEQHADPPVGHFCWYDLNTTDWEGARAFYGELFGWGESGSMDSPGGTYWMFKSQSGDRTVGGLSNMAATMNVPAHWLCYITVADLDAALEQLKAAGGQVHNGPMEVPGGDRIAHCMDPQGAAIALHQGKPA